jgi:hypothetical protein
LLSAVLVFLPGCPPKIIKLNWPAYPAGKNYKSWKQVTKRKMYSNNHGAFQRIYLNDVAYSVSKGDAKPPYPKGSTFVVIRYGKESKPYPFAWVMTKMNKGYDPVRKDWRYTLVYTKNWTYAKKYDGLLGNCIKCHQKYEEQDYIPLKVSDNL